jgi:hypothetical protein
MKFFPVEETSHGLPCHTEREPCTSRHFRLWMSLYSESVTDWVVEGFGNSKMTKSKESNLTHTNQNLTLLTLWSFRLGF